jgi:hypothetical protein
MAGRPSAWWKQSLEALFIDVPYVLDSLARRTDYQLHKRYRLDGPDGEERWLVRPAYAAAIPLVLTLVFAMYGPTFDALCSLFIPAWTPWALVGIAIVGLIALAALVAFVTYELCVRYRKRLERLGKATTVPEPRRVVFFVGLFLLGGVPLGLICCQLIQPTLHVWHWAFDTHRCLGASLHRAAWQQLTAAVLLTAIALRWGPRWIPRWVDRAVGSVLLASACLALYALSGTSAREADHGPYLTAFGVLAAIVTPVVWLLAKWAARFVVRRSEAEYGPPLRRALQRCEVFVERRDPDLEVDRVVYALLGAPLTEPLLLLVIPSFAAVVSGRRQLWSVWWISLGIAWFIIALGSISSRWNWQITLARRWLLTGLPLVLSVAVLGLAVGRLADFDYVAYVLDSAPFGAITLQLAMLYALAWLLEHSLNEPLQAELLSVLEEDPKTRTKIQDEEVDRVRYPITAAAKTSRVRADERYVQIHGVGRFAVVGILESKALGATDQKEGFHTYDKLELFEALLDSERAYNTSEEGRLEWDALLDMVHGLRRRVSTYFAGLNTAIAIVLALIAIWVRRADTSYTREPLVEGAAVAVGPNETFDLAAALQRRAVEGHPVILVAASGGGTRAALFAAGALRGLKYSGFADDVVLMSGVSGGGASLAYFASHRDRLLGRSGDAAEIASAWADYADAMSFPYIEDVLEGAGEYRMVREQALGRLLSESFERTFARDRSGRALPGQFVKTYGGLDAGLILNTTITAHPYSDSQLLRKLFYGAPGATEQASALSYSRFSGGRLIFTNLNPDAFPDRGMGRGKDDDFAPDVNLIYKVFQNSQVPIVSAAALNANFPPVFNNIGVWETGGSAPLRKYYVTDGGVNENRGLISLLFALRGALERWPQEEPNSLPCIHIVALDASAMNFDYSQDRGISAVFSSSAGERLASGLERRLLGEIEGRATHMKGGCRAPVEGAAGRAVRLHYLVMPAVLTTRGGFGTHWMLPDRIRIHSPAEAAPGHFWERRDSRDLDRADVQHLLIHCLFPASEDAPDPKCRDLFGGRIPRGWLGDTGSCSSRPEDPPCVDGWKQLREDLRSELQRGTEQ